jgi:hypothetical protein
MVYRALTFSEFVFSPRSFDPLRKLAQTCRTHRVWLHADGAWGGAVIFSQTHRALVDGLERSFFSCFFLFCLFFTGPLLA